VSLDLPTDRCYHRLVLRRQAFRYRLSPTRSEAALLRQFLGCSRFVWNAILAENQFRHAAGDPLKIGRASFCERLVTLKERHVFLREAHSQPLQQTLNDLVKAYERAFDPKLAAEPPVFKKKQNAQGIRFPQGFRLSGRAVFLPKIGWMPIRASKRTMKRKIAGEIKNVTVRLEAGLWYVSFQTERDIPEPAHAHPNSRVGGDVGVAKFLALSDGTCFEGANALRKFQRRLATLQRRLAKKLRFSANWRKAKARITKLHSRIANVRKDQIHKASYAISKNHAVVAMEDLRIKNMTATAKGTVEIPGVNVAAKSALNRRMLDQGWGELRRQVGYKLKWSGGKLKLVDPRNTSRTCSQLDCGHVSSDNRLTQADFLCVKCGHTANADTNAAINILGRAG
jgi:putative transposase